MMNKVVWERGMHLLPEHFQQWDRHYEQLHLFDLRSRSPYYWGVTGFEIDENDLKRNRFTLLACEGVFQEDALWFKIPEMSFGPLAISLENMAESALDIYLTIPDKSSGLLCNLDDQKEAPLRYVRAFQKVRDHNSSPGRELAQEHSEDLGICRPNLKLSLQKRLDHHDNLQIARLVRVGEAFQLDKSYIPPALTLQLASKEQLGGEGSGRVTRVQELNHRLSELLLSLSSVSHNLRKQMNPNLLGRLGWAEMKNVFMLNTLQRHIPFLDHVLRSRHEIHPEQLFAILSRFASDLMTWSDSAGEVPAYNHQDLNGTIFPLCDQIEQLAIPQQAEFKAFQVKKNYFEGRNILFFKFDGFDSAATLRKHEFFLAINSELREEEILQLEGNFPKNVRIGSQNIIDSMREGAFQGVIPRLRKQIPEPLFGEKIAVLFSLPQEGDAWLSIERGRNLAMWVPNKYLDYEMTVYSVAKEKLK